MFGLAGVSTIEIEPTTVEQTFELSACSCCDRQQIMDTEGPKWCEDNLELCVGWLVEAAERHMWLSLIPAKESWARGFMESSIAESKRTSEGVGTILKRKLESWGIKQRGE